MTGLEIVSTKTVCNGVVSLTKVSVVNVGDTNCPYGGNKIETGLDADGNGVLDTGEVVAAATSYVCKPIVAPPCLGCALLAVPFTAAAQSAQMVANYSATYEINQTASSILTASVMVTGATSGDIQLGVQQGSGSYSSCFSAWTPLTPLVGLTPVNVTFDLTSCALTGLKWVLINVRSGATFANPTRLYVDNISLTNAIMTGTTNAAAAWPFASASSVGAQYASNAAWLNGTPPSGTTLGWYNN